MKSGTWWLLSLLAVPLFYVLTGPPVVFLSVRYAARSGAPRIPAWIGAYGAPYEWAMDHTAFGDALEIYAEWWDRCISDTAAP